jgi:hypothetical protein
MRGFVFLGALIASMFVPLAVANALTISPVTVEVAGDPGVTLRGELELFNEQNQPKTFYSSFENFEPSGETGSPRFVGSGSGLATWLDTTDQIVLQSNETVKVPYTITIPADAEPGGYFAAIFWGEQNPETLAAGELAIGGRLGVLILLRVNGAIEEGAGIIDFAPEKGGWLRAHVPVTFSYRFNNTGGDRVVPEGSVRVTNLFGSVVATFDANPQRGSVLPGSTRRYGVVWSGDSAPAPEASFGALLAHEWREFRFGWYRAELALDWQHDGSDVLRATTSVVLVPWRLLLVGFLLLGVGMFALRRYNRWIIARSQRPTS